ncbi:MAG: urease accessory protein UreF [Gammaproteobacteria bacterium]|nr:urease accessory protein UreF [Gammaproteobacteria bacterium]
MNDIRLWQLISPALPIGAYAYSQGFESAVENQLITSEDQAYQWISGLLQQSIGQLDSPIYLRLHQAWQSKQYDDLLYWHRYLQASRESSEFLSEDQQLGTALLRLLKSLSDNEDKFFQASIEQIKEIKKPSFLLIYTLAVVLWDIDKLAGLKGFLWSWCENQVAAAIKLVPLGQTSGQILLKKLMPAIDTVSSQAEAIVDENIGSFSMGLSILSAKHEQQYSRLFRS